MPVGIHGNNQTYRRIPSKWCVCGGCGYKIKVAWGACPVCDGAMGTEVWREFLRKNPGYREIE
jgi:hypothetical protein